MDYRGGTTYLPGCIFAAEPLPCHRLLLKLFRKSFKNCLNDFLDSFISINSFELCLFIN
ncbi:hypothetical protein ACVWYF_000854 [Hymenobacter sp. UYAg731]